MGIICYLKGHKNDTDFILQAWWMELQIVAYPPIHKITELKGYLSKSKGRVATDS